MEGRRSSKEAARQRVIHDLQDLPRFSDGWTFLYVDKVRIERDALAIALVDESGTVPVPAASLSALILGPGTTVTHAAMLALAESGCSVIWSGEGGARFYAGGIGETRRGTNAMAQATAWADPSLHLEVIKRMYRIRFPEPPPEGATLEQLRGFEGVRVREAYAEASRRTGVAWTGRAYRPGNWNAADPVNRALSAANACLYGLCHAAIVATGFVPALGFIHTGKMLSFVYDVADLYKVETTIPVAFDATACGTERLEARVRRQVRDKLLEARLLDRIVPDIQRVLGLRPEPVRSLRFEFADENASGPGQLWDPERGAIAGGRNFGRGGEGDDEPGEPL
jgi:CRISPR-associated protein Cas1